MRLGWIEVLRSEQRRQQLNRGRDGAAFHLRHHPLNPRGESCARISRTCFNSLAEKPLCSRHSSTFNSSLLEICSNMSTTCGRRAACICPLPCQMQSNMTDQIQSQPTSRHLANPNLLSNSLPKALRAATVLVTASLFSWALRRRYFMHSDIFPHTRYL